jgi:hypothetical protein
LRTTSLSAGHRSTARLDAARLDEILADVIERAPVVAIET